jgi:hypothetical protein
MEKGDIREQKGGKETHSGTQTLPSQTGVIIKDN